MIKRYTMAAVMCVLVFAGGVSVSQASAEEKQGEKAARRTYREGELPKLVSVVQTDKPPIIDGIMEKGEWDWAASITGLTVGIGLGNGHYFLGDMKNVAADQSTFWLSYDDKYLYVAYHCPPPASIKDSPAMVAVMLNPQDMVRISLVDPYPYGDDYWIFVHRQGVSSFTHGSATHSHTYRHPDSKLRGIDHNWKPNVVHASTMTLDGWKFELAIPWEGYAPYVKRPEPGGKLHLNFGRHWKEVMNEDHIWMLFDTGPDGTPDQLGGPPDDPHAQKGMMQPAGDVVFQGKDGVVVQLEDVGNLPRGQAKFVAKIANHSASQRKVVAGVSTDSGELKDTSELTLKPQASTQYSFEGRIADFATTKIVFTVTDAATNTPIHVTTLPVIRKTKPGIYTRRYRSHELVKFETDMGFIGAVDPATVSIALTMSRKDTGKRVFSRTFKGFTTYEPALELSTKDWTPGDYEMHFAFSAPGMKTYETTIPYEHAPLPEWWNNQYGYDDMKNDRVPYPWTNMEVADQTVKVWGRDYQFGNKLLPEQITTLDYPMLRSPMRIVVKTVDGEVLDTSVAEARTDWTKKNKTRVEGSRVVDGKGLSLKNTLWSEYDGVVWNTVAIEPNRKVKIRSMELEVPLTREFTDVINSRDYSLGETGELKPDGFTGSPTTCVWLGNGDGGIQWLCETDGRFFLEDAQKALRVEVKPEGATLRVVMIDVPTDFDALHEMQFGFIATPARPKTWRTPEHSAYRSPIPDAGGGAAWYQPGHIFVPAPDIGHAYGGGGGGDGCLYVFSSHINTRTDASGTDDFKHFGDEWLANSAERAAGPEAIVGVTSASKSLRDWFVWRYWRFQQKYGYGGLYYDGAAEVPSRNRYAFSDYVKRDGATAYTIPILGTRDIQKRLYNVTLSNPYVAARDMWIGEHQSGEPNMAYMGFSTHNWNGENFNAIINEKQQTYRGVVDPAMFRAELMGHNFGWPVRFLGQSRIRPEWIEAHGGAEAVYDQLTGLVLLHDTAIPYHMPCCMLPGVRGETAKRLDDAIEKHRYFHWAFQFTPYWHQDIVSLPDENMHASFYISDPSELRVFSAHHNPGISDIDSYFDKHLPGHIKSNNRSAFVRTAGTLTMDALPPKKAIMIVYNNTEWEGKMRLKPDWKKLGFDSPEGLKVENAVHSRGFRVEKTTNEKGQEIEKGVFFERPEEYAKIENGELVFPMTKWDYRMIVIEKETSR
jgi:hypothetical protein